MSTTRLESHHIVESMIAAGDPASRAVQMTQLDYRIRILDDWTIPEGARILEIGCGQGDMTAVLAHAVAPHGHITAVDIASPDYGAPLTLGRTMTHLAASNVGNRIGPRFGFDVLDPANTFPDDAFDIAVLVHGAWYFTDLDQLGATLRRIRPWARRLLLTEWDMEPIMIEQVPHLLSVLIQGQIELYKLDSEANVRSPFTKETMLALLERTGWTVISESRVDTGALQDGSWEVAMAESALAEMAELPIPERAQQWISSQAETMQSMARTRPVKALPSYSLEAVRGSQIRVSGE